jgi:hypothetical protein
VCQIARRALEQTIVIIMGYLNYTKLHGLDCDRTIPTKRPLLVGKLVQIEGVTWSAQRIPTGFILSFVN